MGSVRFRINPRLLAGRHERSRHVPPEAFRRSWRRPGGEQPNHRAPGCPRIHHPSCRPVCGRVAQTRVGVRRRRPVTSPTELCWSV